MCRREGSGNGSYLSVFIVGHVLQVLPYSAQMSWEHMKLFQVMYVLPFRLNRTQKKFILLKLQAYDTVTGIKADFSNFAKPPLFGWKSCYAIFKPCADLLNFFVCKSSVDMWPGMKIRQRKLVFSNV